uniref:Uncharacterized protein n=1 Tax=Arundo donax TaxID=35708 RepID=A0A0A9CQV5_ARUDO
MLQLSDASASPPAAPVRCSAATGLWLKPSVPSYDMKHMCFIPVVMIKT